MREGNGGKAAGREPDSRPSLSRCTRPQPIWSGRLITVHDRNFTYAYDPAAGDDVAIARLWMSIGPPHEVRLAKGRSAKGPVDALQEALRGALTHAGCRVPSVTIVGQPRMGFSDPSLGTRSSAYACGEFRINNGPPFAVTATFRDFDTAVFLTYCDAYDRALCAAWAENLGRAGMTVADAIGLMPAPLVATISERILGPAQSDT